MRFRRTLLALALVGAAACGPRQVEVRTAPQSTQSAAVAVHLTNNLAQAVNVYVVANGTDTFLRQVPGNTTQEMPVQGVPSGTTVSLRAVTLDGTRTYSKANVVLNGTYNWQVP